MTTSILSKVQDLLNLSNGNTNVNECAAAFKAAQRLLTKHKLTMADVSAGATSDVPFITGDEPLYSGTRAITWKGSLAKGICDVNCCSCFWRKTYAGGGKSQQRLLVVGRQEDIDNVRYLYDTVIRQIEALCAVAMMMNRGGGKTFSNNFKLGAVKTVSARLKEGMQEVEQEYVGTTALVLVNKDKEALSQAVAKLKLKKRSAPSRYDSNGFDAGRRAGQRVNLTKPKGLLN